MQRKILQGDDEKRDGVYYEYDPFSKPIGEGGMGVVYKGFRVNASTGGRQVVAIKAMKDGLPDEVYGRAAREAGIRLKNDNLVEMMSFISTVEQELGGRSIRRYYVVSEFLNGVVLTDLLKGNFKNCDGIEVASAKQMYTNYITDRETTSVKIIKRVLAGIMALHDKGYIHRDIDPSNIMVTKEGNLKMIDFGIAKYVGDLGTQDSSRTATGKFIGKAEYASPELVLGAVNDQSFTTDIYAIGILFYQLLVGSLPFDGPQYDILQAQLKKKIPLRKIPYRAYRPIIKKATEKRQSDRYQSCVEMRHAIDHAHPDIDWSKILKIAAVFVGVCVIGYGGYRYKIFLDDNPTPPEKKISDHIITPSSGPSPVPSELETDTRAEQYANALKLLDSGDATSAKQGWSEMMKLADSGYEKAISEVGVTYCIDSNMQTEMVKNRRNILKLGNQDSYRKKSVEYLKNIENSDSISGEALAVYGIGLWRNNEIDAATKMFIKAKQKMPASHPLYKEVQRYLNR